MERFRREPETWNACTDCRYDCCGNFFLIKSNGAGNNENYDEMIYEGYAAGGVAVVIEAMTDNKNRTAGDIRKVLDIFAQ